MRNDIDTMKTTYAYIVERAITQSQNVQQPQRDGWLRSPLKQPRRYQPLHQLNPQSLASYTNTQPITIPQFIFPLPHLHLRPQPAPTIPRIARLWVIS